MTDLLRVEGLWKRYPGFSLQGISFCVKPGRIMGLIGKNGAGKSTALKAVLNMVHPDSGTVTILGKDFFRHEKECKQKTGVVFGGIEYYPFKRLSAITAAARRFYPDWDQNSYEHYLRLFSLEEAKQMKTLSNGERVKYLLALALSHNAQLYLLDEPTSGLDPVSRDEILQIFSQIVQDGKRSVLFSTHITSDLDRCAHDITYIQDGRILESGGREEFFRAFEHLKTPQDSGPLTLEEIMLRTEGKDFHETAR